MIEETALPASETARDRAVRHRLERLERNMLWQPAPVPSVLVSGTPEIDGYASHSATSRTWQYRGDVYVTAPVLDYDVQSTDQFGTAASSITIEIQILGFGAFADTVLVTDTGTPDRQLSGYVDLVDTIGDDVMGRFVGLQLGCYHTGGSGDAAAVRFVKPLLLRVLQV